MSLRGTVLVSTGLAFAVLAVVLGGSVRSVILDRFAALERAAVQENVERARAALHQDIEALERVCTDWAQWDDAYRFMVEDFPAFEQGNLELATLVNLDVDAVVFAAPGGEVRRAIGLDAVHKQLAAPPSTLLPALAASGVLGRTAEDPRRAGLLTLPDGVMLVAGRAILTSNATGPSRGTLVMAQRLTPERIRKLGQRVHVDVQMMPCAARPLASPADGCDGLSSSSAPAVVPLGTSRVRGRAVLPDVAGKPAMVLQLEQARAVYQLGLATIWQLLFALLAAVGLIAGAVLLFLEHSVLAPLARLGKAMAAIAATGSPGGRVPIAGRGELAAVARHANAMLEALASSRERLEASEARLRHLVESAPDVIFTVTVPAGRLATLNPAFARLTGWPPEKWIGQRALRLVAPRDRRRMLEAAAAAAGGTAPPSIEVQVRTGRGETTHCDIALAHDPSEEGGSVLFGVARDITLRKRLEAEVMQAQKMQVIGMLTGGVAHDFNNLLQAQLSLVQLVRLRRNDAARREQIVSELEALIQRGAALTKQLLVFARRDVSKREELDLADVLRDAVALSKRVVRENIRLEVASEGGRIPVLGDRGQLGQVALNLVANAVDAMPDGGRITLRVGLAGPGEAVFEVADTGCGMPEEVKTRIFEPFFTTKQAGHGTGLGLAVVDSIARAHGGRVSVESAPGCGSTFRVILPVHVAATRAEVRTPPALPPVARGHGERVLVVEDEEGAREALRETLESLGYHVEALASAEEAGLLPAEPEFDLLLTDQMLPGAAGIDLATGLVDRWPDLAVVVMSGYSEGEVLHRAVRSGQVRFLQKPFDLETLGRELRTALDARAAALAQRQEDR